MDEQSTAELERLDEAGIRRILVVVAHPDDAEYGTSAAAAMWSERGIDVGYLLLTRGEAGMQRSPEEAAAIRATEQRIACETVGVDHLTILDFPDGMLEYGLPLRKAIAREIRRFRPDAVVSGTGELRVAWGFDHADHRAAGLATIDAIRDADNRWVFPDLNQEGFEPWGATWMLLTGGDATHGVEVSSAAVELAVASLAAHEQYLADLPWHPAPRDFVPGILEEQGRQAGFEYGVAFDVHRLKD
ncbi:PIG-L deacetylase family protein [uncultured Agrococcus sp.]|uniref:PIG-L deacetylase family protein n=1 Tax=uncultured Agrococcus sp. TaxID=382258 RepID=UPI0025DF8AD0|nr:PIG-L deacetylase family protein [uncultured Agrococcus sp.]